MAPMHPTPWRINVITLMPDMYPGPLAHSLVGDALARGLWELSLTNLRDFGIGPHQKVDDTPYGGGAGMVLKPDVVDAAIVAAQESMRQPHLPPQGGGWEGGRRGLIGAESGNEGADNAPLLTSPLRGKLARLIHFTPRGTPLTQSLLRELIATPLILLCGRYEAIDERVLEKHKPLEISLGDFVLTGGDIPAMALLDGCVRLLPGVVGKEASLGEESFGDGEYAQLLEYPHYTKPAEWEGRAIPEVLLSGHHAEIAKWRRAEAEAITRLRRPDLVEKK